MTDIMLGVGLMVAGVAIIFLTSRLEGLRRRLEHLEREGYR